jgi:hypothetical protein
MTPGRDRNETLPESKSKELSLALTFLVSGQTIEPWYPEYETWVITII